MRNLLLILCFLPFFANAEYVNIETELGPVSYWLASDRVSATLNDAKSVTGYFNIPSQITYNSKNYNVTAIAASAFAGNTSLWGVTFPTTVTSIGESAFEGCSQLGDVVLSSGITEIKDYAFRDCIDLNSVILNEGLETLGYGAFRGCKSLTTISLPSTIKKIGTFGFEGCSSIATVNVPDVKTWLNIDFQGWYGNPVRANTKLFVNGELLTDLVVPEDVTQIKQYAFEFCDFLQTVKIHSGVTSFGMDAFKGFKGELEINCDIPTGAFRESGITKIVLGDGVRVIGEKAFYRCSSLKSIIVSESLMEISEDAFL